jgi:hypothetical protein
MSIFLKSPKCHLEFHKHVKIVETKDLIFLGCEDEMDKICYNL